MPLRIDADCTHETPEEWYEAYGGCIYTQEGGVVSIRAIDTEWLDLYPDDGDLIRDHVADLGSGMTQDERVALVAHARAVWDAATDLAYFRALAVDAYRIGDAEEVVDCLVKAACEERRYGGDPAASALAAQLLVED